MPWKQKVAGGFGSADVIYAGHAADEQRAKEAIKDAKTAGASFEDFEKEIVWHVYRKLTAPGMQQTHIEEQVAQAKKLWKNGMPTKLVPSKKAHN